jgi:ATP-dependent Clp endopeptidase proteolytic subunit ClpP
MIRIYGEIGYEVLASDILSQLDAAKGRSIDVHINSPGGEVFQGLAIYNALSRFEGEVNVYIDGLAASIASVIAMAGNKVSMASASLMMIHNPATFVGGDQHQMAKAAEMLDTVRQVLVGAYTRKSGMDSNDLIAMLDAETWMDAETAKRLGFVDAILESELDIAACLQGFDLTKFKHVPEIKMSQKTEEKIEVQSVSQPAVTAATTTEVHMDAQAKAAEIKAAADAATAAERKRVADITNLCGKLRVTDMIEGFVSSGASLPEVQTAILETLAEREAQIDNKNGGATGRERFRVVEDKTDKIRAAATDWLLHRVNHVENGSPVKVTSDNPFRGARLLDIARESLVHASISTRGMNQMEIVNAAITHSTSDFPNILQDAMHKTLLNGFNTAGDTWSRFCAVSDLSDFRPHYRHIMGSFSDLAQLNENGEIQDGTLDDTRREQIVGKTMARILNLSAQAIVNDDMSVFTGAARALGRAARRSVEKDVYALLALGSDFGPVMSDSQTLFHSTHGNVSTGAVNTASISLAINTLKSQKLPNASSGADEFIDLALPPIFVGPLGLAQDAKVVNEAQYDHDSTKLQQPNKSRGLLGDIVGTPRRTGTPWFLFANPSELPVLEVGFVQGQREPVLVMEESFRQYGVAWRVVYDYGVAAVNWLGCIRSTGA